MTLAPFYALAALFTSFWPLRTLNIRLVLIGLFLGVAFVTGRMDIFAVLITVAFGALWWSYRTYRLLFSPLILISLAFKFHFIPGFGNYHVSGHFWLNLDSPLIGLFPLAFLVPLANTSKDWITALTKGLWISVLGIVLLSIPALLMGTVHFEPKLPTDPFLRYFCNLFLVAIPEEAFYRGFVQEKFCKFFNNDIIALVASSLIFTAAHLAWSPNLVVLGFVFLAGLLYGGVYLYTKRIESAILCHFLLNFAHMTFFSYHAM